MADTSGVLQGARRPLRGSGSASLFVDAGASIGTMRNLQGAAGMPGPAPAPSRSPMSQRVWRSAQVRLVRTYDWVSRLDTVDNPDSLFPKWSADPDDPGQLQFRRHGFMDQAGPGDRRRDPLHDRERRSVQQASRKRSWPSTSKSSRTSSDITSGGWGGGGFVNAVTRWEFGDQPDFGKLHFAGTPDEFYEMYAAAVRAVKRVELGLQFGGPCPAFGLDEGHTVRGFSTSSRATSCRSTSSH